MMYENFFKDELTKLKTRGEYRIFAEIARHAGNFPVASYCGRDIVVWCSNDYLALSQNHKVLDAMRQALYSYGAGSGGTRNIAGTTPLHTQVEDAVAKLHDKEAGLVFTSGFVANETILATLGKKLPDCVFFSDAKNHASIISGIKHCNSKKHIFGHNNVDELESMLAQYPVTQHKVVAFESVYSMDGDIAPIEKICKVAKRYGALTYLDEVHGLGLYGARGGGVAQEMGLNSEIDIIQANFGKAVGLIGGYMASTAATVDFIRSFAPGFIFTTSLPPVILAGVLESIKQIESGSSKRERLKENVRKVKERLTALGIPILDNDSHLVPVMIKDPGKCKKASDLLLSKFNIYIQPINYPTVDKGTERLRIAPSPYHTDEMIQALGEAIAAVWDKLELQKAA